METVECSNTLEVIALSDKAKTLPTGVKMAWILDQWHEEDAESWKNYNKYVPH